MPTAGSVFSPILAAVSLIAVLPRAKIGIMTSEIADQFNRPTSANIKALG